MNTAQQKLDSERITYRVDFPESMNSELVRAWFRQVGAGLYTGSDLRAHPSVVFEALGTSYSTNHLVTLPWQDKENLVHQLQEVVHGVSVTPLDARPVRNITYADEYDVTNPDLLLPLDDADVKMRWISILAAMGNLADNEELLLQWVVRPLDYTELPSSTPTMFDLLKFRYKLHDDKKETASREAKNSEPSFAVSLRVGAVASTESRARHLVHTLYSRVSGNHGFHKVTGVRQPKLIEAVKHASSPRFYDSRLTTSELVALVGWPLGDQSVIGVSRDAVRHRAPNASVLSSRSPEITNGGGITIGTSTVAGRESTIAIDYTSLTMHAHIGGTNGSGKTTVMSNMARQAMEDGHGAIVLDPKGDLFTAIIDNVPPHRYDDVIVIDFTDGARPVGFNVLEQGDHHTVIDELVDLFEHKYGDKGVYFRQLMYHGLQTIAELGDLTFNDLLPLIAPRDPEEEKWARKMTDRVNDRELQRFWKTWWADPKRYESSKSTTNRIWQLTARPETRYMLGQSKSSFYMDDVIRHNKILLVNLSGVAEGTTEMIGTMLFNSIWSSAQRIPANLSNLVFMDEFHMFTDLPLGFDEVQAMARKYKLNLITATQYPDQMKRELQQAILNNARNKIILNCEGDTARFWARFFASGISESDIGNLPDYVSMTRLKTPVGMSAPFTMKTLRPPKPYGSKFTVAKMSMERYGRSVEEIRAEEDRRRDVGRGRRKLTDEEGLRIKLNEEDGDEK